MGRKLRGLARNVNLQDPEAVRTYTADQPWSSGHKGNLVNAYDHYLRAQGLSWEKPVYERVDQIQRIPRLEDINKIISGASPKYALAWSIIRDIGLRPIEVSWLRVRDIDLESGQIYPRTAKHGAARTLKLKPSTLASLKAYITKEELGQNDRLFHSLKQIKSNWCRTRNRVVRKLGEPELRTIRLYDLRHYFATTTYRRTKDIVYVQRLLGHKNIQNTLRYLGVVDLTQEEYIVKAASSVKESTELIEQGFEYVATQEGKLIYRKPKR